MHIAMLSGEYPPRWGGMGSVVFHLSGHLARLGHRVTVLTRSHTQDAPSQEGVSVIEVPWFPLPMQFTRSYGRAALRALQHLHADDPVDVIHTHLPLISLNRREHARLRAMAPVVASLHGSWLGERDGMRLAARHREAATWRNPNDLAILISASWYARFERIALLDSDRSVANSLATEADFRARYRPPEGWRAETVLWGVDHEVFRPLELSVEDDRTAHHSIRRRYGAGDDQGLERHPGTSTPLLLAVGRLVGRKGFRTLLRAMPVVLRAMPGASLVIVGRGHMRSSLLKQAARLGIEDSVHIESELPFDDLARLYRSSDLVVYPSYYEGQGLVPLEAMASGTPIVTVDAAPLTEMVDASVGGLFPLGDAEGAAETILALLRDHRGWTERAIAGRQRVLEQYTYARNAEDFDSIYASVINERASPG